MSINMDSQTEEYADYFCQVVYAQNNVPGAGQGNTAESDQILEYEPISDRGIDSDELAELLGFRSVHTLQATNFPDTDAIGPNTVYGEAELGINLSNDEFPSQSNANNGGTRVIDEAGDGTGVVVDVSNYEEPGVLDTVSLGTSSSFYDDQLLDASASLGGGSDGVEEARSQFFFRDHLGTGPFVDRTDDLTLHHEAASVSIPESQDTVLESAYIMYWDVHEMPEGRASFARP